MKPVALFPGEYYHIYNRGNNREDVFVEDKNYHYFLKLYARHIEPVAQTYVYCLLRNHFHFLVRIKEELLPKQPSQAFSNLFNAYARAFNKMYQRTGALFQRPFGRVRIESNAQFLVLMAYIHQNPQKHGFVSDFREWAFSSYQAILSEKPTRLQREVVLAWFDNVNGFLDFHGSLIPEGRVSDLIPEDID